MTDLPRSPFAEPYTFGERLVAVAIKEIGVREQGGPNRGPRVEEYLASVGLKMGFAWCAAFVHWCCAQARRPGENNPCPKTGGVLRMYELAPKECVMAIPMHGRVFILDKGNGKGHCGIVETIHTDGTISSIEGNTNAEGSREGDRVARHRWAPDEEKRGIVRAYLDFDALTV